MRLTRAGEYAVRCVLYIYKQGSGKVVSKKEIAQEMGIPEQFLGKVAKQLAKHGILEILQGKKGGYKVSVQAESLTLLDVVEAIDGEIFLNDCLLPSEVCFREDTCAVHIIWKKARERLRETLREADFATLLQQENCFLKDIT